MENYLLALDKFCEQKTITKEEFRKRFPDKKQWHREVSLLELPRAPFRRFEGYVFPKKPNHMGADILTPNSTTACGKRRLPDY